MVENLSIVVKKGSNVCLEVWKLLNLEVKNIVALSDIRNYRVYSGFSYVF